MLIDSLGLFFDAKPAAASDVGAVTWVMPFIGRAESSALFVALRGPNVAPVDLTLSLKESEDGLTFKEVATFRLRKPDKGAALLGLVLPSTTVGPNLRLDYTLTGAPAGLFITSGIARDIPAFYEKGQYLNGQEVA